MEKRAAQVDWAASQAAMDAEARMAEAFAQQLEKMHELDVAEVKVGALTKGSRRCSDWWK